MLPTDLTVAAVIEKDGKFLTVEERSSGVLVYTQPGGHIESGESPEEACVREVQEESRCDVAVDGLLGVYLWIHPQTRQQFLRIVYAAIYVGEDPARSLDDGIHAVHWMSRDDLEWRRQDLRTPIVLRCVDDYLAGKREHEDILHGPAPIQHRVADVLASALLV